MILRFKPVYKERIWGGQNLKFKLNKIDLPAGSIGESWEKNILVPDLKIIVSFRFL